MKVLIITRGKLPLPNIKGGAVEYLIQLLIDENERSWHENFTVCTIYEKGIEAIQEKYQYTKFLNIDNCGLPAKMETGVRYLINTRVKYIGNYFIAQIFKQLNGKINNFDVVIDENAPDFLEIIRKRYKGRFIFHSHNDWLDAGTAKQLNFCDEYWTISRYLANKIPKGLLDCEVHVLYNGIRIEDYASAETARIEKYKSQLKIERDDIILVYAGRIVPEKGVMQMLHAFTQADFPENIKLIVAGGAFYSSAAVSPYIKNCMEYVKNKKNVIFTGYIPGNEIAAIYALADIGIFPSLCQEAFGLTALEMMSGGLPVITTLNGAIPEIVNEQCGYLLSTEDEKSWIKYMSEAMQNLVKDKNLRESMGKKAKVCAADFCAEKYLKTFEQLLFEVR